MILIDTSSWVEALRARGRAEVRERVNTAIQSGEACWCDPVRLELWNGQIGEAELKKLHDFDSVMPLLPIDEAVWTASLTLARQARTHGLSVPAMDLLIAACAFHYHADIESTDVHFQHLLKWR